MSNEPQQKNVVQFGDNQAQKVKRVNPRPTKSLPTDRITFQKQISLLRAYAAASGVKGRTVKVAEVADIAKMSTTTVSVTNGFFGSIGLLLRSEAGLLPSQAVIDFGQAFEWQPDVAGRKLAPVIEQTWFAQNLLRKLTLYPMSVEQAVIELAQDSNAPTAYKNQVRMLIDYLELAGLVIREGEMLKRNANWSETEPKAAVDADQDAPDDDSLSTTVEEEVKPRPASQPRSASFPNLFTSMTSGAVRFNISIEVNMEEFATWEADRLAAFFNGIAQVLAAKAAVEKEGRG